MYTRLAGYTGYSVIFALYSFGLSSLLLQLHVYINMFIIYMIYGVIFALFHLQIGSPRLEFAHTVVFKER